MKNHILEGRRKAIEEAHFRKEDSRLIAKLRQRADLDEIALALAEKLQIEDAELLNRVENAGVTAETSAALFLALLVQVAWSDGSVSQREQDAVLRLAVSRGLEQGSPAYATLEKWLQIRPSDELFDIAVEVLKRSFSVLTHAEHQERVTRLLDACREVASASAKEPGNMPPIGPTVGRREKKLLKELNDRLCTSAT